MTKEKSIWPDWKKYRTPEEKEGSVVFSYNEGNDYVKESIVIVEYHKIRVGQYWSKYDKKEINKYSAYGLFINLIATPQECEARKKEGKSIGYWKAKKEGDGGILVPELSEARNKLPATGEVPASNYTIPMPPVKECIKDNPWIPGNEPENVGEYEVTLEITGTVQIDYWNGVDWEDGNKAIAYKRIHLSSPYVKPERKLRCPFCNSKDYNKGENINGIDFYCKNCKSIIRDKTRKEFFKIYDKLNPLERK